MLRRYRIGVEGSNPSEAGGDSVLSNTWCFFKKKPCRCKSQRKHLKDMGTEIRKDGRNNKLPRCNLEAC